MAKKPYLCPDLKQIYMKRLQLRQLTEDNFSDIVRALLDASGRTSADIARRANLDFKNFCLIRDGKRSCTLATAVRILSAFGRAFWLDFQSAQM